MRFEFTDPYGLKHMFELEELPEHGHVDCSCSERHTIQVNETFHGVYVGKYPKSKVYFFYNFKTKSPETNPITETMPNFN